MWDLPGPGLEPMSPALAGGFLTTAPPGKSLIYSVFCVYSTAIKFCKGGGWPRFSIFNVLSSFNWDNNYLIVSGTELSAFHIDSCAVLQARHYGEETEAQRHEELAKFIYRLRGGGGFEPSHSEARGLHLVLENHSPREPGGVKCSKSNPTGSLPLGVSPFVSTTQLLLSLPSAGGRRGPFSFPVSLSLNLCLPTSP